MIAGRAQMLPMCTGLGASRTPTERIAVASGHTAGPLMAEITELLPSREAVRRRPMQRQAAMVGSRAVANASVAIKAAPARVFAQV